MYSLLNLILIDLYECDHERLISADLIKDGMLKAAEIMGAEVIGHSFHTFRPWGVSGTVIIAESHLAIHTWPEFNFASITFETCGSKMNHQKAFHYLVQFFGSKRPEITRHKRGFIDLVGDEIPYKQEVG